MQGVKRHVGCVHMQAQNLTITEKAALNFLEGGRQGQHAHKLWQNSELAELSREVLRVSFCLLICLLPTDLSLLLKHRKSTCYTSTV